MMRQISLCVLFIALGVGGYLFFTQDGAAVKQYVGSGEVTTLEARYTAAQIVEANRGKLRIDAQHTLEEPYLRLYPYLLMEVKYNLADKKTREAVLLWGMTDGEIVINTDSWETTHGFKDALDVGANRNDLKLLFALDDNNGVMSREELLKKLHVEPDQLENWVASARQKQLIVQKGNNYYLHFESPKLNVIPQTKITQALVTLSSKQAVRIPKRYSVAQIEKMAKAAFGTDFTIRSAKELFLPVYSLDISNPDGSLLTTEWNALTGQRVDNFSVQRN